MMMIIRSQCARVACVRSWMISFSFLSVIIKIAPICLWSFFYMWPAALRVVVHLINTIWAVANKTRSLIINSDRKHRASLFIWTVTLLARARGKNMCVWSRKIIYCCECLVVFFSVGKTNAHKWKGGQRSSARARRRVHLPLTPFQHCIGLFARFILNGCDDRDDTSVINVRKGRELFIWFRYRRAQFKDLLRFHCARSH